MNLKTVLKVTSWVFNGKIEMSPKGRENMLAFYQKHHDKMIEIVLRVMPRRSVQENRYYFGVIVTMVRDALNEQGNELTLDETHEVLKSMFNSKQVISKDGELLATIGSSTTLLNSEEFSKEYCEKIRMWAADFLGIYIGEPGQQMAIDYTKPNR